MTIATPASIYYTSLAKGDVFSVGPNWGEKSVKAKNDEAWVKGDFLQVDQATGILQKTPAGSTLLGKFAVAARPKETTSAEGIVFGKDAIDKIVLVAGAVIKPNNKVKAGAAAQKVDDFVEGTTIDLLEVGVYVGHGTEVGSGDNLPTDSADNDLVVIEINPANWI